MMDLRVAEQRYQHGTRARYVMAKCRCDDCRKANREYQVGRDHKARQAAMELGVRVNPRSYRRQVEVTHGKLATHIFRRSCPGIDGKCPWRSYLRKDSANVCAQCSALLLRVPATKVQAHLLKLSEQGVGYKAVADAASVARTLLQKIRSGEKTTIMRDAEQRVLEVDAGAMLDAASIDGAATRQMLEEMRGYKLTWEDIGHYLGVQASAAHALSKRERVLLKTEHRLKKILKQIREDYSETADEVLYCPQCTVNHPNGLCPIEYAEYTRKKFPTPEARRGLLLRIIPPAKLKAMNFDDVKDLRDQLPKLYGVRRTANDAGYRLLHRDLTAIGYVTTRTSRKDLDET